MRDRISLLLDEADESFWNLSSASLAVIPLNLVLAILSNPQLHILDQMSMYSIGAASKNRGILEIVQYLRNPTSLDFVSLGSR